MDNLEDKSFDKPVEESVDKSEDKTVDKPVDKTVDKTDSSYQNSPFKDAVSPCSMFTYQEILDALTEKYPEAVYIEDGQLDYLFSDLDINLPGSFADCKDVIMFSFYAKWLASRLKKNSYWKETFDKFALKMFFVSFIVNILQSIALVMVARDLVDTRMFAVMPGPQLVVRLLMSFLIVICLENDYETILTTWNLMMALPYQ